MCLDNSEEMDFSYVHKEIYNLKDVPRKFDEELYLKLNVSKTVIDYWKKINYKPSYYYLFWLLREVSGYFNFEEYRALRDTLISGVRKENEKIGKDLELYAVNENEAYDNFIRNDGNYMYFLSEEYEDRSECMIIVSISYDDVIRKLKEEVKENKKNDSVVRYWLLKYPIIMSDDNTRVVGIDIDHHCGQLIFDSEGELHYMLGVSGFKYDTMTAIDLFNPYIFIPHPFKQGDIVKYNYCGEYLYGALYYAADVDERESERSYKGTDGSNFRATIYTIHKNEKTQKFESGHDHVCPLYFDSVDEFKELDEDFQEVLTETSRIMKEEEEYFLKLLDYLGETELYF